MTRDGGTPGADAVMIATLREVAGSPDPATAWLGISPPGATPWRALLDARVALGPVRAARSAIADAAAALEAVLAIPAAPDASPAPSDASEICADLSDRAGGGAVLGRGRFVDRGGNDTYGVTGYGETKGGSDPGVGLLPDEGGTDTYADQDRTTDGAIRCSGAGTNRTVAPKCLVGGQIDVA